ncbi:MAG: hypothetical protein HY226_05370 [Candidatus Vogelbacteria bacterium]|nr:hypothetical protein [Candidatus Vogelbacteria bacterium]
MAIGLKTVGRPPILIAGSVKEVVDLKGEYAPSIMNRAIALDDGLIGSILAQSVMSWNGKNPSLALDPNGNFQGTDLDLFSFLTPLANRRAVIEIPRYRNRRKIIHKESERKIGTSQFGTVTGLISNKDVMSFSVRLWDMSIAKTDENGVETLGANRNYMIVDCDSHWYDGWDKIIFKPSAPENDFLTNKGLWTGNTVYFKYYVHPNRWQSIFGAQHLLKLLLVERLDDEAKFYKNEVKRLEALKIFLPTGAKPAYEAPTSEGATEKIQVNSIEFELDRPDLSGKHKPVENTEAGLRYAYERQKYLTYTVKPQVRFAIRANEAAYFQFGQGKIASWMEGRQWVEGYKLPKGRIEWNAMRLSPEMMLRYRIKTSTQTVSAE